MPHFKVAIFFILQLLIFPLLGVYLSWARLEPSEAQNLIKCYHVKLSEVSGEEKYKLAFRHFSQDQMHKLFIDKIRLEYLTHPKELELANSGQHHLIFDVEEPGYYLGMTNAFNQMSKEIDKRLDLDLLVHYHDIAVAPIFRMRSGLSTGWRYHLPKKHASDEAITELVNSGILFEPTRVFGRFSPGCSIQESVHLKHSHLINKVTEELKKDYLAESDFWTQLDDHLPFLRIVSLFPDDLDRSRALEKIGPILSHYYDETARVRTYRGKLAAIAELVRAFEVAHFFPDGNQRVYAFIVLTKLLIENNLPPAILDDPQIFDGGIPLAQLVTAIDTGIQNFLNNDRDRQLQFLATCQSYSDRPPSLNSEHFFMQHKTGDYTPLHLMRTGMNLAPLLRQRFYSYLQTSCKAGLENRPLYVSETRQEFLPLEIAILLNDKAWVNRLLERGADPFKTLSLSTPMDYALDFGQVEIGIEILAQMQEKSMLPRDQKISVQKYALSFISQILEESHSEVENDHAKIRSLVTLAPSLALPESSVTPFDQQRREVMPKLKQWAQDNPERIEMLRDLGLAVE